MKDDEKRRAGQGRSTGAGRVLRIVLIALALAAAVAACGYALYRSGWLERLNSVEDLREMIAATGIWGGLVYFLMQMMTVIVAPIPSNVTMMAGALALGFWKAMVLGVLAVLTGSVIVFLAARRLGRRAVQRIVDNSVLEKYLPVIEEKQDTFLFLTLLFPFFPDDAICILAGLTSIPLWRFVCIMALTRPWGLVFAALLGSGAFTMPAWAWVALGVPMIVVFVLAMRYGDRIENWLFETFRRIGGRKK